jgi:hypothetical protein
MIKDEGLNNTTPSQFQSIAIVKFLLFILSSLFLIILFFSYDSNIFTGLTIDESMVDNVYHSKPYTKAYDSTISGLIITSILAFFDFIFQIFGYNYNYNIFNIVTAMTKTFEVFLLYFYYIDSWHYYCIFHIMCFQFICTGIELYIFIYGICFGSVIYDKIRSNDIRYLMKHPSDKQKVE